MTIFTQANLNPRTKNQPTGSLITNPRNSVRGFTLIEILITIAIIIVLAAVLIPTTTGILERNRQNVCLTNLRSISGAINLYLADNGTYPSGGSPWGVDPNDGEVKHMGPMVMGVNPPLPPVYTGTCLYPYIKGKDLRIFQCPSDPLFKDGWCSYGYNGAYLGGHIAPGAGSLTVTGVAARPGTIDRPGQTVMLVEGATDDMQPPSGTRGGYNWENFSLWFHKNGMNVAFCDGHVEWRSKTDEDLNAKDDRLWSGKSTPGI